MEVEYDSTDAVALINADPPEPPPWIVLIRECKVLLAETGCTLKHTLQEGNKVADRFANMGV